MLEAQAKQKTLGRHNGGGLALPSPPADIEQLLQQKKHLKNLAAQLDANRGSR